MATKAELEAELAKLRSEMSALKAAPKAEAAAPVADQGGVEAGEDASPPDEESAGVVEALRGGDLESVVQALMDELEDLPSRKPIMTALGAFVIGYLIGRSGSKG